MQGLVYPLTIVGGSLQVTNKYPELVRNAIVSSLHTQLEERVFRPDYGLDPQEFQTLDNIVDVLAEVRSAIDLALVEYPGVTYSLRGSINEDGQLDAVVLYQCVNEAPERVEITI